MSSFEPPRSLMFFPPARETIYYAEMKTVEKSENSVPNAAGSRYAPLASPFQTFPEDCDEQMRTPNVPESQDEWRILLPSEHDTSLSDSDSDYEGGEEYFQRDLWSDAEYHESDSKNESLSGKYYYDALHVAHPRPPRAGTSSPSVDAEFILVDLEELCATLYTKLSTLEFGTKTDEVGTKQSRVFSKSKSPYSQCSGPGEQEAWN